MRIDKIFFFFLASTVFLGVHSAFGQIDNTTGSFKIPAIKDTTAPKQEVAAPKENFNVPRSPEFNALSKTLPNLNSANTTTGESGFYMLHKNQYADAGQRYTDMMNERQRPATKDDKPGHQEDQDLGTFNTGSKFVKIICRDYSYVDGDRVSILVNDQVVQSEILLGAEFIGFNLNLQPGFNRISFKALNQGSSGPNTAQFVVYDDAGNVVSSNEWNLLTGVKANLLIVKQ